MSSRINFNDTVSDRFEFQVGGKDFDLIFPTLTELQDVQNELISTNEEAKKKKLSTQEAQIATSLTMVGKIYEFVKPVGHEEKLEDVLATTPSSVAKVLNEKLINLFFGQE